MPHGPQVTIHALHHVARPVAELPAHRVEAHRRALVERLEPRRTVGVPEHFRRDRAPEADAAPGVFDRLPCPIEHGLAEPRRDRDGLEELPEVGDHRFRAVGREAREQKPTTALEHALVRVGPEDLLELRPEGHHARRALRLQAPVPVPAEGHRLPVEAHVGHLEAEHLGKPAAR